MNSTQKLGLATAVLVVTMPLCPLAEERPHVDVAEYSPVNSVGRSAIAYVSSGDVTVALTGVQATATAGFVQVGGASRTSDTK